MGLLTAPAAAPAPARREPRITGRLLRAVLTLQLLAVVAQPVLIGGYLDGDFDLLGVHGLNGSLLALWTAATGVVALVHWLAGGRAWPVAALTVLWFAVGAQIAMGYARVLVVHVTLGVAIVAACAVLAGWSWTRRVYAPRRGWW